MTVAAVSMMMDEADIAYTTVRNIAEQVDFVIVADNGSTDGTREQLEKVAADYDVTIVDDPDPAYYQGFKMTKLAHVAGERGADWVVPFDADEVWMSPFGPIGEVLGSQVPERWGAVEAHLYDHVTTAKDRPDDDPVRSMVWRQRERGVLPKVAARYHSQLHIDQGNHSASIGFALQALPGGMLVVRHFPYRNAAQFVHKVRNGARAYALTGDQLPADYGAHWRQWGSKTDAELEAIYRVWYWRSQPQQRDWVDATHLEPLTLDPCPLPW